MPLEDVGFWEPKVSVLETLNASSLQFLSFLVVGDTSGGTGVSCKGRRSLFKLTKMKNALYKHLRACTNFIERYGK